MPSTNPFLNPKSWAKMSFLGKLPGGVVLVPGIIKKIDGHDPTELWIVQKAQNSSFATTVWRGRQLNESIKVDLTLADAADFEAYVDLKERMQPKPPKAPDVESVVLGGSIGNVQVWNVINGALNFAGISRVAVRSIGVPRAQPDLSWDATIDLIQYRPRVIAKVGPPEPPKQHAETENDRLAKEVDNLAAIARTGKPLF